MRRLTRLVRAAVVTVVAAGPLPLVRDAAPAAAQIAGGRSTTVVLVSQDAAVGPGDDLPLRLRLDPPDDAPGNLEVAVTVDNRLTSRADFAASVAGRRQGSPVGGADVFPVDELVEDGDGVVGITVDISRLGLFRAGAYPVHIDLRERGGDPIGRTTTYVTFTPATDEPAPPTFGVTLVLPFHAPPGITPDGRRVVERKTSERLAAVATALADEPDVPLSLLPTPETLESLASVRPAALDTLRGALAGREVMASGYVPFDLPALLAADLPDQAADELITGVEVTEQVLGVRPESRTWVSDERIDERSLTRLREQQFDRLVLPSAALEGLPRRAVAPLAVADVETRQGRRVSALVGDTDLAGHFTITADALEANRLLAHLTVLATTVRPAPAEVAVLPPRTWEAEPDFVAALLSGLDDHPLLRPATASDLLDGEPDERDGEDGTGATPATPVRRLAPLTQTEVDTDAFRTTRQTVTSFWSMLEPEHPLRSDLQRVVITAPSLDHRTDAERAEYLDGARTRVAREVGQITIEDGDVTLPATSGTIPLAVRSGLPYPVRIRVEVSSERLDLPQGSVEDVQLVRPNTTVQFVVRAKSSGTFPLRVRLASPDGTFTVSRNVVRVRSTAFSGLGLLLTGGAGAFLVVWWARHLRRGRRARRLVPLTPA